MYRLKIMTVLCFVLIRCVVHNSAQANDLQQPVNTAIKPESNVVQKAKNAIPIMVELEGTDTVGAKIALELKNLLNSGTEFVLTNKDVPKLRIIINTTPEFPSRPNVGSAYSITWLYSIKQNSFSSYLTSEVGAINIQDSGDLAIKLAQRSSGIVARYAYLFEK